MALLIGELYGLLRLDDSDFSRKVDGAQGKMRGLAGTMGGILGRAALGAGVALGAAGVAGVTMGLRTAASLEQADIAFTTMLGSARKADAFLKQLSDFAAKTPFEFPELQTAASSLISAGVNARKVIPIMTSLGNATSGMGTGSEGIKRATVALQQMNAAGKITGEDLNQLRDAGIPVFDLLAAATGKSKAEVAGLAAAGKLGARELAQLMKALETGKGLERFSGLMDKQSQSLSGLISTAKDTLNMGLAQAVKPLLPLLKDALPAASEAMGAALQRVSGFISAAVPAVQRFMRSLGESQGFQAFLGVVRSLVGWFTGSLLPAFQRAGAELLPKLQGAFASISGTIQNNRATFDGLGRLVTEVILPVLTRVAGLLLDTLGPAFKAVVWVIRTLVIPAFAILVSGALTALNGILKAAALAFGWVPGLGPKLKKASAEFSAFTKRTNESLAGIVKDVYVNVHVQPVIERTLDPALHNKGFIGPTIAESLAARGIAGPYSEAQRGVVVRKAREHAKKVGDTVGQALGSSLASGVAATGGKVADAATGVMDKARDAIREKAKAMRDSVADAVSGVLDLSRLGGSPIGAANALKAMAARAEQFVSMIRQLVKRKIAPELVAQIAGAGVEGGWAAAAALSRASKAQVSSINRSYGAINAAAGAAGQLVANDNFGKQLRHYERVEDKLDKLIAATKARAKNSGAAHALAAT